MATSELIATETIGPVTVLFFREGPLSLTDNVLQEITQPLLQAAEGTSQLLCDLSCVQFFGSSFLEILLRLWKRVRQTPDGQFALCGLHPHCQEVLEITNLTSVWTIYADRDEALQAMSPAAATT
ncbi:STAS domain-containing protein [Planctomicrobium sp. SH664]|uniref:STAS domain-containing protein n=1 Tax=Planctomicrobium sp. SH664 TaxID=3448125 RepID=UPI003F5B8BA8